MLLDFLLIYIARIISCLSYEIRKRRKRNKNNEKASPLSLSLCPLLLSVLCINPFESIIIISYFSFLHLTLLIHEAIKNAARLKTSFWLNNKLWESLTLMTVSIRMLLTGWRKRNLLVEQRIPQISLEISERDEEKRGFEKIKWNISLQFDLM